MEHENNEISLENLSESDKIFLREMIESLITDALKKSGMVGDF